MAQLVLKLGHRIKAPCLVVLLLCLPACAWASITPSTDTGAPAGVRAQSAADIVVQAPLDVTAENVAIATAAEAAVAVGKPAKWLVSFRVPESQVDQQTQAVSTAAGLDAPTVQARSVGAQQVYAAIKSSVLGSVTAPAVAVPTATAASVTEEAGPRTQTLQVLDDYSHLPITFVSIASAEELLQLRSNPYVASVQADGVVRTMAMNGLEMIGQPAVLERGFAGSGTVVTIDTGLDYTRPAFGPCTAPGVPAATCKVSYVKDFAPDDKQLDDPKEPHGTNVAGIIVGVAPGVKIISLDVFQTDGTATWSDLLSAVNWAVASRDVYNITAINLSLGGGEVKGACDDHPLAVAIATAYTQGIISAAAAGNEASEDSLIIPACASKAVSVGAVHAVVAEPMAYSVCRDTTTQPDSVACFSNSAQTLTMLAPGVSITAAGLTMSGTSQATPFVAAALALLRSRFPTYTNEQIVSVLTTTGVPVKDARNGLTRPRLNLRAAMSITCTPKVTPSSVKGGAAGGTYTLTVTPPTADCQWTVQPPTASWMRFLGPTSGTGPGTVTLQIDPVANTARSSGVSVTPEDGSNGGGVLVSQPVTANSGDIRPPLMGRLQATTLTGGVALQWPAARDSQSGVSSYRVVYNEGTRPPAPRCISGTPLNQQPAVSGSTLSMSVTGLTPGQRYTFRVCALDAAANVAFGSMWRGTASR